MPVIEQPEPRGAQVARTINRHIEAVLLGTGFLLGSLVTLIATVLS